MIPLSAIVAVLVGAVLATDDPCKPGGSSFACSLGNWLHVLYVIAGVLAGILIAVIAFAVNAWRKARETDIIGQ